MVKPDLMAQLERDLGSAFAFERELGGGGMSRVFLATERALGRSVVIKVLPPEAGGDVWVERFRREVALTGASSSIRTSSRSSGRAKRRRSAQSPDSCITRCPTSTASLCVRR